MNRAVVVRIVLLRLNIGVEDQRGGAGDTLDRNRHRIVFERRLAAVITDVVIAKPKVIDVCLVVGRQRRVLRWIEPQVVLGMRAGGVDVVTQEQRKGGIDRVDAVLHRDEVRRRIARRRVAVSNEREIALVVGVEPRMKCALVGGNRAAAAQVRDQVVVVVVEVQAGKRCRVIDPHAGTIIDTGVNVRVERNIGPRQCSRFAELSCERVGLLGTGGLPQDFGLVGSAVVALQRRVAQLDIRRVIDRECQQATVFQRLKPQSPGTRMSTPCANQLALRSRSTSSKDIRFSPTSLKSRRGWSRNAIDARPRPANPASTKLAASAPPGR